MASRDLDGRFSNREKFAVKEWINSNKAHHIMRDHPGHKNDVLAGMWGSKLTNKTVRLQWKNSLEIAFHKKEYLNENYASDQGFLKRYAFHWSCTLV